MLRRIHTLHSSVDGFDPMKQNSTASVCHYLDKLLISPSAFIPFFSSPSDCVFQFTQWQQPQFLVEHALPQLALFGEHPIGSILFLLYFVYFRLLFISCHILYYRLTESFISGNALYGLDSVVGSCSTHTVLYR